MALNFTKGEIIAIDKPYRMTSFGALAYVRSSFGTTCTP